MTESMTGRPPPRSQRDPAPHATAPHQAGRDAAGRSRGGPIRVLRDCRGVTAIEYGIIAGVIMVALGVAFAPLGGQLATFYYERVTQTLVDAAN